ncbi:LysE family translocator [Jannaschia formosa]|uniref:LysE family translocator n=1 Tax=Jannaschia formosa TaxID=2259592 RepID=UPI000E1B5FC7|nr:LysE family translocator [Jannaschia formosa]TFL17801.1 LysE family translocator [Jannaschia formosa]
MPDFLLALWPLSTLQVAAFLPAALLVGLTPGPNNFLALATAGRAGPAAALRGLIGRCAAFAVLTVLVALGLDRLLAGSQLAFSVLKWGGVAYLCYLAWRTWTAPVEGEPERASGGWREFLTCMANPKAYLLMTAFLPQFLGPGSPLAQLLALGALYIVMEAIAALAWIGAGTLLRRGALTARGKRWLNRVFGGLMGLAALLLARAARPG